MFDQLSDRLQETLSGVRSRGKLTESDVDRAMREIRLAGSGPTVILMAGLQGSGKTTACAKLAKHLAKDGKRTALVACDTQRPAAVEQLVTVGKRAGAKVYEQGTERDPVEIAEWALDQARAGGDDVLIFDTAG